jgi:hypothetical protein
VGKWSRDGSQSICHANGLDATNISSIHDTIYAVVSINNLLALIP